MGPACPQAVCFAPAGRVANFSGVRRWPGTAPKPEWTQHSGGPPENTATHGPRRSKKPWFFEVSGGFMSKTPCSVERSPPEGRKHRVLSKGSPPEGASRTFPWVRRWPATTPKRSRHSTAADPRKMPRRPLSLRRLHVENAVFCRKGPESPAASCRKRRVLSKGPPRKVENTVFCRKGP